MGEMRLTAPQDALGYIIDAGQDGKTEIPGRIAPIAFPDIPS
jgi:hypothetical protein